MEKLTFGERLRREREMRGVSLEEIAAVTRISTRFLNALENEEWERLPGGVFNRGFIRAVARFLGLDEDGLVAEYATTTNDRPQRMAWLSGGEKPQRTLWPWVVALIVVAVAAGGWFGWRHRGQLIAFWNSRHPPASAVLATAPAQAPPTSGATGNSPSGNTTSSASADEPATLQLKVGAGKGTHLSVTADGIKIFDGDLSAGENRQFEAKGQFDVTAQDSNAVLLELNGQTVPPLGPPGQPGSITLTRKDLKRQ